jgi:hypothetical protein
MVPMTRSRFRKELKVKPWNDLLMRPIQHGRRSRR